MNEKVFATLKSAETEDWFDMHIMRPLSYLWVRLFDRLNVHPNTVTVLSMIIGGGSCIFFAHGSFYYEGTTGLIYNMIAILLLMWAALFDCVDGQLARLTGKKSRLGRILDGVAGFMWYIPIYFGLTYRFYNHHSIEFGLLGISDTPTNIYIATAVVMCLGFASGLYGLASQQRLADYYIQIHLFSLKGAKGSELDTYVQQKKIYEEMSWKESRIWKFFQKTYVDYTRAQEAVTPEFQNLRAVLKEKYNDTDHIPQEVFDEVHRNSLPLMKYVLMLMFNFRTLILASTCLLDVPVLCFILETFGLTLLAHYVNRRHEGFCRRIAVSLNDQTTSPLND